MCFVLGMHREGKREMKTKSCKFFTSCRHDIQKQVGCECVFALVYSISWLRAFTETLQKFKRDREAEGNAGSVSLSVQGSFFGPRCSGGTDGQMVALIE